MPNTQHSSATKGNVLFLILIAVALFAALSYAVTQSSKTGGSNIGKDKAKIIASEIIQYATSVEQAVSRITLMNGCTDTQISFENPIVSGFINPNAPADKRCHILHLDGGGVAARKFPAKLIVPSCTQLYCGIYNLGARNSFQYIGTDAEANGDSLDLACKSLAFQRSYAAKSTKHSNLKMQQQRCPRTTSMSYHSEEVMHMRITPLQHGQVSVLGVFTFLPIGTHSIMSSLRAKIASPSETASNVPQRRIRTCF